MQFKSTTGTGNNETPCIAFTIPLLVRVLELVREDVSSDVNLHFILEQLIALSAANECLNMSHYESIAKSNPTSK